MSLAAIQQAPVDVGSPAVSVHLRTTGATLQQGRSLSDIASEPDSPMDTEATEVEEERSVGAALVEEVNGHKCDFCSTPLGANTAGRFFRCGGCDSRPTVLCEACCFELHLCRPDHEVQEWNHSLGNWVTASLDTILIGTRMAVHCGNCCVELGVPGRGIPVGAVQCPRCDTGVLCVECCAEAHACQPLHHLQVWTGSQWEMATLRDIGFVYQMGHGGNACAAPTRLSWLMVISDQSGNHFLNLRYCNCGKYGVDGETSPGKWLQIRRHGWFASALKHARVCTTFKVWPDVDRLD
ncbi:hypothetical protein B0H16DRAFT_1715389 [Mycena metata]|uniref:CxC2-like cysteine cluster KDZ transposase-associated domain-containing protein n=1 Tax=Mycena metata TaxID=1033252 RepID=A0AAD7JSC4_9AGAR|nr:hypothetical protein B0H16DRAFT_1715389 [Mycena metata]